MKKLLLSSLIALTLGSVGSAQAANSILFDRNGSAAGGLITVDTFDWTPDNALIVNGANPTATNPLTVLAQGSLGGFVKSGNIPPSTPPFAGTEFTFELSMLEASIGIGTATVTLVPVFGTINVWYDPTGDANQLAGTGYGGGGDAVLILTASIVPGPGSNGTFTDLTLLAPGAFPRTTLDQFAGLGNNYPTVMSDQGSGNTNLDFNVTFAHPDFFKSDITSLLIGMQDSSNATTPFKLADPAALVVGVAPVFTNVGGTLVNGAPVECATSGQTRCDFLIQTDASTSFQTRVPEPGSLALLGLALGGLGWSVRRRRSV